MSRYIDADALDAKIDLLYRVPPIMDMVFAHYNHGVGDAHAIIHNMPTADVVEVKHGRWIDHKCSLCEFEPYNPSGLDTFNFCSNCGADMRGGNNDGR